MSTNPVDRDVIKSVRRLTEGLGAHKIAIIEHPCKEKETRISHWTDELLVVLVYLLDLQPLVVA